MQQLRKTLSKRRNNKAAATLNGQSGGTQPIEANLTQARALLMELLAIPGGSGHETQVAGYIRERLRAAGAPASAITHDKANRRSPAGGEIGNLVYKMPGSADPRRLLMAHMDTVPICVGAKPVRRGGFIHAADKRTGLGGDDRAGVAVLLSTALSLLASDRPHPPLTFLWTVQEELGLHGAHYVEKSKLGNPKLAFNWDGGPAQKVTIGATGGYRMGITIHGLASHAGGAPERGVSAIAIASLAIAQLVKDGWHGEIRQGVQRGTSNVGVIRGGEATNVVTDRVELRAEARSHDLKFRQRIVQQIERAFQRAAREVRNVCGEHGRVEIEGRLDYESFRLADDEPCVTAVERAISAVGLEPLRFISNGGLDANWMSAHGIPTATLGCGQMEIHTTSERLDLTAFDHACQIALRLAAGLC